MRTDQDRKSATRKKLAELSDKVKKVDRDVIGGRFNQDAQSLNSTTGDCDGAPGPC